MTRSRFFVGAKKAGKDASVVRYRHWSGLWYTVAFNTEEAAHAKYKSIAANMDSGDLCAPLQVELTIT